MKKNLNVNELGQAPSQKGFTMIELMVVVMIVGILAAVAYPNYTASVVRSNRTEGQDRLVEIMYEQERLQVRRRSYSTDLSVLGYGPNADGDFLTENGLYSIAASVCGTGVNDGINNCVVLTATPLGMQAANNDAALTLSSRGTKTGPWGRN